MKAHKELLRNKTIRRVLCWLLSLYIKLAYATSKWTVVHSETAENLWSQDKPFILGFWHGRMMMMPYCWNSKANIYMLVSQHTDGQTGADIMAHLGIKSISGSSAGGGTKALRALLKTLKNNDCVAIAPDGPRGPMMRASEGIISLARLSGVPIVAAAYSVNRGRMLSSWDRFLIALPFTRGVMVWGEAINIPRDADDEAIEKARLKVENALNSVTREADMLCGRTAIKPDRVP